MIKLLEKLNPFFYKEVEKLVNYGYYGKKKTSSEVKCNIQDIENYVGYLLLQKAESWQRTAYQTSCKLDAPDAFIPPQYETKILSTLDTNCGYIRVNLRDYVTKNVFMVDWRRSFIIEGGMYAKYMKVSRNGFFEYKTDDNIVLVDYVHISVSDTLGNHKQIRFFLKTQECQPCLFDGHIEEITCAFEGYIEEIITTA